jgi:hypothetical protein
MAQILCKLLSHYNSDVVVGGKKVRIGEDGFVTHNGSRDIPDDISGKLLANTNKYANADEDIKRPLPGKRAALQPILVSKTTGAVLSAEETAKLVKADEPAKDPTEDDLTKSNEPPPPEWPEVSIASTKKELMSVWTKLFEHFGEKVVAKPDEKKSKTEILEIIEAVYDQMT